MSGTFTLAHEHVLLFSASATTGITGLYDATLVDGRVTGTGSAGQQLEARRVETLSNGTTLLAGTVNVPDTKTIQAFALFASAGARGEFRLIVTTDGRDAGSAKAGQGARFHQPYCHILRRTGRGRRISPRHRSRRTGVISPASSP